MSSVLTPTLAKPIVDFLTSQLAVMTQGQARQLYTPDPMLDAAGQDSLLKAAAARAGDAAKAGTNVEGLELAMEDAHTAMALGRDAEHARASRIELMAAYANDLTVATASTGALQGLLRLGAERGDI